MAFLDKVKQIGRKISETGTFAETLKARAGEKNRKIVLCEGEDKRVVEAAAACVQDGVARIVLLGNEEQIKAANPNVDLTGVEIIEPVSSPDFEEYADLLYSLRKGKGMTEMQAREQAKDNTFFGALMLKRGEADGLAGRENRRRRVCRFKLYLARAAVRGQQIYRGRRHFLCGQRA